MSTELQRKIIPDPWLSFLRDVDQALESTVEIHCIGAFALLILTGAPRPTADIDFIKVLPGSAWTQLLEIGGMGSQLAAKYGLHLDGVTVAEFPSEYRARLIDVMPSAFEHLRVMVLEPHDVVLTKVSRNSPKDREDVRMLVERGKLDADILRERYEIELKPFVLVEEKANLTMELWLDEFFGEDGE